MMVIGNFVDLVEFHQCNDEDPDNESCGQYCQQQNNC